MKEKQQEYLDVLCFFCRLSASLQNMKEKMENGEDVSEKEASSLFHKMAWAKERLLSLKEELGIEDGLEFTDNVKFKGFSYQEGMLSGDYGDFLKIVLPLVDEYKQEKSYLYEVGCLLMFHYMAQEAEKKKKKRRKILGWLKRIFKEWFSDITPAYLE